MLTVENKLFFSFGPDGVCAENIDTAVTDLVRWEDIIQETKEVYENANGLYDPECANDLRVIAAKLRKLADEIDQDVNKKEAPQCL